ncbi:DUF3515 family protein [Bogoriella caseilytica]|uniref:Uncharacterized protein DUF3515 n=1 Tax=Bogoriella caseilytica TaxID=56055 RepID=A0A3N2BA42_9MICO|nr:DUF3515 family protein [Bogoriella caseilytica]ROR71954.1 uncharacterized protein DUF3515 [Bogoriella caseilytica]
MPRRVWSYAILAGLILLTGCAAPVDIPAGSYAADPACAEVLLASPDELQGFERRSTSSQATTAWGSPAATLRCGVAPPPPTTDRCVNVEVGDTAVDWVSVAEDEPEAGASGGAWTFITYGRVPAVEVVVPVALVGDGQAAAYLAELGPAVSRIPAERACVGAYDVEN